MDRFTFWLVVLWALFTAFCIYGCNAGMKQNREWVARCESAGGVPFRAKHGRICLDPAAVRGMPR